MRVTITEPCVIEYEGTLTIHPIPDMTPVNVIDVAKAIAQENGEVRHRRYRRRRGQGPCLYCGEMFSGKANQLYCTDLHKRKYYDEHPAVKGRRRHHGVVPVEQGLAIKAGAKGVDVEVVDR